MLREVLGRQPRKYELEAWFSYLDFDRSAAMSRYAAWHPYTPANDRMQQASQCICSALDSIADQQMTVLWCAGQSS
jgi:hypothetical protein